jgi:transposase
MAMSKEELWTKRMRAFERSGLSRRAWCAQEKVALSTLDYWRLKLGTTGELKPSLVPVVVADSQVPVSGRIEVSLGGVQLRLPATVDAAWLCSLLRGLR